MNEINLWPSRLSSLQMCQPCILAAGPASICAADRKSSRGWWSLGWGWVGWGGVQRCKWGRGFIEGPYGAERAVRPLSRQVVKAGEMRACSLSDRVFFFNFPATATPHFLLLLCHFTQLEDTLASFCRSLSFCWQEPQKRFSVSISVRAQ